MRESGVFVVCHVAAKSLAPWLQSSVEEGSHTVAESEGAEPGGGWMGRNSWGSG